MEKDSIQKGLELEANKITERIPMSKRDIKNTAATLRHFMDERSLSQSEIARRLKVSPAAISQFLKGQYAGDTKKLANKVVGLINSMARQEEVPSNKAYIKTTVAKRIATLITNTESFCDLDEGKIGMIIGDGGHGKSRCLREFAKAHANSVYIQLDATMTSTDIFSAIAVSIGVSGFGMLRSTTKRIIEDLKKRQLIIMLDEASSLTVKQLNQLRQIIVVKSRCPLILSGNSDLLTTINQSSARRGHESLDQFRSRLMGILNIDELAAGKGTDGGVYTADDIRKLYQYGGIRLTTGAVRTLKKIVTTPRAGRLRTCGHIVTALHTAQKVINTGVIETENIIEAIEYLNLPVDVYLPVQEAREYIDDESAVAKAG